jgi:hypothetical protein
MWSDYVYAEPLEIKQISLWIPVCVSRTLVSGVTGM